MVYKSSSPINPDNRNTNPRRATMRCFGTYEAANVEQEISVMRGSLYNPISSVP